MHEVGWGGRGRGLHRGSSGLTLIHTSCCDVSRKCVDYSGSEDPARLVCKSMYSGALCEVISGEAKIRVCREAGVSWPKPFFFYNPHLPIISLTVSASPMLSSFVWVVLPPAAPSSTIDFLSLSHTPSLVCQWWGFVSNSNGRYQQRTMKMWYIVWYIS